MDTNEGLSDARSWARSVRGVERQVVSHSVGPHLRYPTTSIQMALRQAVARLQVVTDAPRLEGEVLLAHVLQVSRTMLLAHPERVMSADEFWRYSEIVQDRLTGYPLPYLTGTAEFYALSFEVTPEVLIPRPETETLIDLVLACHPASVVDVGTGSGCIAIALAVHLPETQITAIELSPAALVVAQRNAERHGVAGRIHWMAGDVLAPRPGPVDLVVSNPPYIRTSEIATLPVSIRGYEPTMALDGGADGLAIVRQLLNQAPAVLGPGGRLMIEIGADQAGPAIDLARTVFPSAHIRIHPDLAGHDRVLEVET